jgi:hypothetical protein
VDVFLSHDGHGPEYQALRDALADLGHDTKVREIKEEIAGETTDKLARGGCGSILERFAPRYSAQAI